MATISSLVVNVIARTTAFQKGMRKSKRSLYGLQKSALAAQRRIASFAKAMIAMAGVYALGRMISRTIDAIDATAKLADRIGITTEDLIGLRHAANLSGVGIEAMDKAIATFIRRLGEMRMGVGQAQYALDALKLTATELVSKSPAESMGIIADKIKGLTNAADKAAAAYYLFGRQGMNLLNMFEAGSKGIAEMMAETKKLGLAYSRLDAQKVVEAKDAFTRLKAVWDGMIISLTIEMAPLLEAMAESLIGIGTAGEGMGTNVVNAFRAMAQSGAGFAGWIQDMKFRFKELDLLLQSPIVLANEIAKLRAGKENAFTDLLETALETEPVIERINNFFDNILKKAAAARAAYTTGGGAGGLTQEFLDFLEVIEKANTKLREQNELFGLSPLRRQIAQLEKMATALNLTCDQWEIYNNQLTTTVKLIEGLERKELLTKITESFAKAAEEQARQQEKLADRVRQIWEQTRTPLEQYTAQVEELNKLFERHLIDVDTYHRGIRKIADMYDVATAARGRFLRPGQAKVFESKYWDPFGPPQANVPGLSAQGERLGPKLNETNQELKSQTQILERIEGKAGLG